MIELMFALALDMSLPEFQPQEDLSGNYIVGTYDVSNDDVIVEEVPVEALDSLSVEPQQEENTDIEDLIEIGNSKENYFKSTSSVEGSNVITLPTNTINNISIDWNENQIATGANGYIYVTVYTGITYTVDTSSPNYFFTTSFNIGSSVTTISNSNTTFTTNSNGYLFVRNLQSLNVTYVDNSGNGGDVSGNGGSVNVDLTNIESKLDNIITLQRSILLVLLVSFLFPIIISCVKLLKGGKDV